MAVKVFLSWSGDLSRELAEAVKNWLPGVLQFVRPYFTPDDTDKGVRWDSDIAKELDGSNLGIIFLTKDNLQEPWILFEAGALSKKFDKAKVCTTLFDLEPTDIKGPLTLFQHTKFEKDDFKKLMASINKEAGDTKLDSQTLDSVFDKWWPDLDKEINSILERNKTKTKKPFRPDRELLEEILELTRLSFRKSPNERSIHPAAYEDLAVGYSLLQKAIKTGDIAACQESLQILGRPIDYIIKRNSGIMGIRTPKFRESPDDSAESIATEIHE
ncbi:MAG: hypothetical protein ABSE00_10160 [Chitinispirillaceae bacterium]|jgi:hypothetical protein